MGIEKAVNIQYTVDTLRMQLEQAKTEGLCVDVRAKDPNGKVYRFDMYDIEIVTFKEIKDDN